MGRIIVFTGDDLNSKRVMQALDQRDLPYAEVCLSRYPSKMRALARFTFSESLPQVFFNTRLVGGVEKTIQHLRDDWDGDKQYASINEKYDLQIRKAGDPVDIMSIIPKDGEAPEIDPISIAEKIEDLPIHLPDGTKTTIVDITEKLKNTLPREDHNVKNCIYKNSFSGVAVLKAVMDSLQIAEDEAMKFCQNLISNNVIHHVDGKTKDFFGDKSVYRLQCFSTLKDLNSYLLWQDPPSSDLPTLVSNLEALLSKVEYDSLTLDGAIDYQQASNHGQYHEFEGAVCELQGADLSKLNGDSEKLAFGINVYKLMLRYSFIKFGFPETESDRLKMMQKVGFIVGQRYSFREWVDGFLRGNRKATYCNKPPFASSDERCKTVVSELDCRVHFALNLDARLGSSYGSVFSLYTAKNLNNELEETAKIFCNDDSNVGFIQDGGEISIPLFFGWYRSDFCDGRSPTQILYEYLPFHKRNKLPSSSSNMKGVKFVPTVWTRNASEFKTFDKNDLVSEVKGIAKLLQKFTAPKTPKNDETRVATLHSLNLLDTLPEERFDRITKMVKEEFDVPIVLISLVDNDRQWFKSRQWYCSVPKPDETGRDTSFCGHAILGGSDDVFVIENALEDPRFVENPLVTGDLGLRFYAGSIISVPGVVGADKVNIGTLCLIDRKPRSFSDSQARKLLEYSYKVRKEILRNL